MPPSLLCACEHAKNTHLQRRLPCCGKNSVTERKLGQGWGWAPEVIKQFRNIQVMEYEKLTLVKILEEYGL